MDRISNNRRMGLTSFMHNHTFVTPSYSPKQDTSLIQDDHQARFYADYRKVADEYDKEFLGKYTEDLDTTLIFVSFTSSSRECVLTRALGWSVLRCDFCLHHRGRL